jgi:hypothetical protein
MRACTVHMPESLGLNEHRMPRAVMPVHVSSWDDAGSDMAPLAHRLADVEEGAVGPTLVAALIDG